ncbi:MAG: hypothetical protein R8M38_03750 [Mariprofundaceae bacterium]
MSEVEILPDASATTLQAERKVAHIIYALQAASFLIGISFVAAVVICYIKRQDVAGTWLASHLRWQIHTFWWGMAGLVLGWLTLIIGIGFVILFITAVWLIYRIAKGWIRLSELRTVGEDSAG